MGMFDEYIPDPPLHCPACESPVGGWQGTDGPNALMIWQQGIAAPIDQAIEDEEVKLLPEQLAIFRLPEEFAIYTDCCGGHFFVVANCTSTDETWSRTELVTAETAEQARHERRSEFKARLRWLRGEEFYGR